MNEETLLDRLSEIRLAEIITVHDLKEKPLKEYQMEEMEPEIESLYRAFVEKGC